MIDHGRVVNTSEIKGYYTPVKETVPVYRFYHAKSGRHLYTEEKLKENWESEGIGWYAPESGTPVYHLSNDGDHHYTMDANERIALIKLGWKDEGTAFYSSDSVPVYRLYNPNSSQHHYTKSVSERDALLSFGWKDEGIGWYCTQ